MPCHVGPCLNLSRGDFTWSGGQMVLSEIVNSERIIKLYESLVVHCQQMFTCSNSTIEALTKDSKN